LLVVVIVVVAFVVKSVAMDLVDRFSLPLAEESLQLEPSSAPLQITGTSTDSAVLATVQRVIDGDTIELSTGEVVRYIGIDTPETKHSTKPIECFGEKASQRNKELVEGKQVQLEKDVSETDRYGRLLRYIWLNGRLINEQLVAEGYAFASAYLPDSKYQTVFQDAERQAREDNEGLWAACQTGA